jgi:hypothetical protein
MRHLTVALLLAAGVAGNARAALIGVTASNPEVTLTSPYLIYDHNGFDASTGLLRIVAAASTVFEGAAAGGSSQAQSYFGAGDPIPDLMLTIRVDNTTGAFAGGNVSIGFGNSTTAPRFSWQGAITNFGFQAGTGTIFDATWDFTGDQYQNMPSNMSQFVDGYLAGRFGGLNISSTFNWGATNGFGNDWIYGNNPAANSNLNAFRAGMTAQNEQSSSVQASVFASPVPLPGAVWLLGGALSLIAPIFVRRRNKRAS